MSVIVSNQNSIQENYNLSVAIVSGKVSVAQIEIGLKISDVFKKPIIKELFKNRESDAFATIKTLVTRFLDSFSFSSKLNESQIEIIAVDTFEKFSYESIHDIILFFKMARAGRFGTTSRGVDSNLIFGTWFPMYMEQKSVERENLIELERKKHSLEIRGASKEEVLAEYEKIEAKKRHIATFRYIDSLEGNITREQLEEMILQWEKDPVKSKYLRHLKSLRLRNLKQ